MRCTRLPTSDSDRLMLESLTEQHDFFERKIRQVDDSILEGLDGHAGQIRLLETIPGISLRLRNCQFQGCHKALHVRRGYKRTTVATAHKLLRTIYSVLKNQLPYRDPSLTTRY